LQISLLRFARKKTFGIIKTPKVIEQFAEAAAALLFREREWGTLDWLGDLAGADQGNWNPATNNLAVFDDADFLQVHFELATGNTSRFTTVTAQVFGLTTHFDSIAEGGFIFAIELKLASSAFTCVFL
jgi:hypothetical protein